MIISPAYFCVWSSTCCCASRLSDVDIISPDKSLTCRNYSCDFRLRNEAANKQTNEKKEASFLGNRFRHFQERHKFSLEFTTARRAQCLLPDWPIIYIVNAMAWWADFWETNYIDKSPIGNPTDTRTRPDKRISFFLFLNNFEVWGSIPSLLVTDILKMGKWFFHSHQGIYNISKRRPFCDGDRFS